MEASLAETMRGALVPGAVVGGKYRIDRVVGSGGMGIVFAARQLDLERDVAVKVLRAELARDASSLARFDREAKLASGLASDGAVRIYELGRLASGEPFVVMELLDGEDLGEVLARGPLPPDVAVRWILAACDTLAEAHALGIVHRDVKPQNLFLARVRGSDEPRLKVLDFGLAKLATPMPSDVALTAAGSTMGTPLYMAPEQVGSVRDVDARADVWALGATLHHLIAGTPPFDGADVHELLVNTRHRPAPSLAVIVGPQLAEIVQRCLAKDPLSRFASAGELRDALRGVAPVTRGPNPMAVTAAAAATRGAVMTAPAMGGAPAMGFTPPALAPYPQPRAKSGGGSALVIVSVIAAIGVVFAGMAVFVLVVVRAAAREDSPSTSPGSPAGSPAGVIANLDEDRLRVRLKNAGWTVRDSRSQDFNTGCRWMDLQIERGGAGGFHVFLFDCRSRGLAASEAERLRKTPNGWLIHDGARVLHCHLSSEAESRALCDSLVDARVTVDASAK